MLKKKGNYFILIQLLRERFCLTSKIFFLRNVGVKMIDTPVFNTLPCQDNGTVPFSKSWRTHWEGS
jgi:hypothetical protein